MQSSLLTFLKKPAATLSTVVSKPPTSPAAAAAPSASTAAKQTFFGARQISPDSERLISHLHDPSWKEALKDEFSKPYFTSLSAFLREQREKKLRILPAEDKVFNAFNLCPFEKLKVVIIGQDPYPNPACAMGLSFSVPMGQAIPPSLQTIYTELSNDLKLPPAKHGNLEKWARQGVFLLNAVLTVEAGMPNSHKGKGWEPFTDAVIQHISDKKPNGVVFLLWGKDAQNKQKLISKSKHHVLTAAHPSPLARGAFLHCAHFSKTNALLKQNTSDAIDWALNMVESDNNSNNKRSSDASPTDAAKRLKQ